MPAPTLYAADSASLDSGWTGSAGCGVGCWAGAMGGGGGGGCWAAANGASGPVASTMSDTMTARIRMPVFIKGTSSLAVLKEPIVRPRGAPTATIPGGSIIANGSTARKLDKRYNRRNILSQRTPTDEARALLHQRPDTT